MLPDIGKPGPFEGSSKVHEGSGIPTQLTYVVLAPKVEIGGLELHVKGDREEW
jgi:hypothetical protein